MGDEQMGFLGTGWAFPPSFSRPGATARMVSNEHDIQESLWILLSTSLGERLMLPTYGCNLQDYIFRGISTTLLTEIDGVVRRAIVNWEPRVDIELVSSETDPSTVGRINIAISYVIRQTNARSNLVYPFYISEATIPAASP